MNAIPDIATGIPAGGVLDVVAARAEQIERHGHTAESDATLPLRFFTSELLRGAIGMQETVQFNQKAEVLRRRAVKQAALCLALIDRIDHAATRGEGADA